MFRHPNGFKYFLKSCPVASTTCCLHFYGNIYIDNHQTCYTIDTFLMHMCGWQQKQGYKIEFRHILVYQILINITIKDITYMSRYNNIFHLLLYMILYIVYFTIFFCFKFWVINNITHVIVCTVQGFILNVFDFCYDISLAYSML